LATIPATTRKRGVPTIAFLAHVDTAPDFSGKGVKPRVHRNYRGGPIRYPDNRNLVLDPATYPDLLKERGKTIVTTSGGTLLGSDDKSGVAVVITLAEQLLRKRSMSHGPIRLCFTPDEEIARGVAELDLRELNANVAYTLDGGSLGEIGAESFSADNAIVTFTGVATHPGEGKSKGMVNALHLAGKFLAALPRERCAPETTAGAEGFIHPRGIEGNAEKVTLELILRDFALAGLRQKVGTVKALCRALAISEPRARIQCRIVKQYRNMAYWLEQDPRPVDLARQAIREIGLEPVLERVRGGTDGSRLTEMGLPTPNLFCGEHNAHGPLEWVAVEDMEMAVKACVRLAQIWEQKGTGYRGYRPRA
jgi:tripeptide aminopeptidase